MPKARRFGKTKAAPAWLPRLTEPTGGGWKPADIRRMRAASEPFRRHSFELACADLGIEHRLTKPNHPWTNGQVERMNRTLKDATVRRYHYATHDRLRAHLGTFLEAHHFARRLEALRSLTPSSSSPSNGHQRDLCKMGAVIVSERSIVKPS